MAALNLTYRRAALSDAPRIKQLIDAAFQSEDPRPNWTADMMLGRAFAVRLEDITKNITGDDGASAVILVTDSSTDSDDLVATFIVAKKSDRLAGFAMFSIDQRYQRQRLGRQILLWMEKWCMDTWGVEVVGLNALNVRQELIKWYERCGYVKTGVVEEFPYEAYEGRGPIPQGMHFVLLEKKVGGRPEDVGAGKAA